MLSWERWLWVWRLIWWTSMGHYWIPRTTLVGSTMFEQHSLWRQQTWGIVSIRLIPLLEMRTGPGLGGINCHSAYALRVLWQRGSRVFNQPSQSHGASLEFLLLVDTSHGKDYGTTSPRTCSMPLIKGLFRGLTWKDQIALSWPSGCSLLFAFPNNYVDQWMGFLKTQSLRSVKVQSPSLECYTHTRYGWTGFVAKGANTFWWLWSGATVFWPVKPKLLTLLVAASNQRSMPFITYLGRWNFSWEEKLQEYSTR